MTAQKFFFRVAALLLFFFSTALSLATEPGIKSARELLLANKAACVILKDGKIILQENGRGVAPLLDAYDKLGANMQGTVIVDKVIGRATAAIAIGGKVRHVHAEIMSEDAKAFLQAHGITASHTQLVPRILNRKRDGLCPMEQTVTGITDPAKALSALRKKLADMSPSPAKK